MGLGPLEGLMMGQRSGDVDPTLIQILDKKLGMSLDEIMTLLNTRSGFKGSCMCVLLKILNRKDVQFNLR